MIAAGSCNGGKSEGQLRSGEDWAQKRLVMEHQAREDVYGGGSALETLVVADGFLQAQLEDCRCG